MIYNAIDICADRNRASILFLIIIMLFGYISYGSIPKESSPDVKIPIIYVLVRYDGISPEDSGRLMVKPIENALRSIEGIEEITSYANEGSASVIMEFDAGFDSARALQDVRAKINDIENKLPRDAETPEVHEVNLSLEPVVNVALSGNIPKRTLITLARDLAEKVEAMPNVLSVNIGGDREEALEIIVDPAVLVEYGLSTQIITNIINSNNQLVPAGSIRSETGEHAIKIRSLVTNMDDVLDFPIKVEGDSVVRIRDIAQVRSTYKDPNNEARVNGKDAIVLEVSKRTGANIIMTVRDIKALVAESIKNLPENIEVSFLQDDSKHITDMITDLENSIFIGIILVMFVIVLSVGIKQSFLIALSIPASFFAGIWVLDMLGLTLNVVVLFSLILTIGMIVDDAIVVSEYADRKMIEGESHHTAYITAAKRMLWPVLTSTVVKIIVFMPLLFWPGVIGQFMKYMPITVIAILSASLFFALFMQPSLGPLFGKHNAEDIKAVKSMLAAETGKFEDLDGWTKKYAVLLEKVLKYPKYFVYSVLSILVAVYVFFFFFGTGKEFFPKVDPDSATVVIQSAGNLSLQQRDELVKQVERRIAPLHSEIKAFYAKSGRFDGGSGNFPEDTIGTIQLSFVEWDKRRKADFILDDIRRHVKDLEGIKIQILQQRMGPPSQKPIEFDVIGNTSEALQNYASQALNMLSQDPDYKDIEDSRAKGGIEWVVNVNRINAALYGIDVDTIGSTIRLVSNGMIVSNYRPDYLNDEVDIVVRFPSDHRGIMELNHLKVINAQGLAIPMGNFASIKPAAKVGKLKRVGRKEVISISADVQSGVLVDTKVSQLKEWMENNKREDASLIFRGDDKEQIKTGAFLMKAFVCALLMMSITMLIQFNSYYQMFIIMSAVFLSTVGVLLGLILSWQPFGIVMSGVGIIALSGIVLNNNIIFIDTYQHIRKQGVEVYKAIVMTGIQRLRPIVLTATTAILGLLPMVFSLTIDFYERKISHGAPSSIMWKQLAASIAGGLLFATILTLFFTPCLLLLGRKFDIIKNPSEGSKS